MKKILTIGAYERDNFGDCLFFLVLKNRLENYQCTLVPGSCFSSDMVDYFGEHVHQYNFLLSEYEWDAIWIVGGEIGGCSISSAFLMSVRNEYLDKYSKLRESTKKIVLDAIVGLPQKHLAYLPDLNRYSKNKNAPMIVNSVGGFDNLKHVGDGDLHNTTIQTLKNAFSFSVRSEKSHKYLNNHNVRNILVPDTIHALPTFYEGSITISEPYIIFQMNEALFKINSYAHVGEILHSLIKKYNCKIILFSAGNANYHDSICDYKKLKEYLDNLLDENSVDILFEKSSLRRVDWIKNAFLCVGSSLHVRVVASAYKVPRVSLVSEKVTEYAKFWDNLFPYNVLVNDLLDACNCALSVDEEQHKNQSNFLTKKAIGHIDMVVETLYG